MFRSTFIHYCYSYMVLFAFRSRVVFFRTNIIGLLGSHRPKRCSGSALLHFQFQVLENPLGCRVVAVWPLRTAASHWQGRVEPKESEAVRALA